ncbi:serine proteinase stubble [Copidosoma floridanum]|uniref:serine proteinase stubble n=1 Tax=Copidosoma floridanum TaxID=29053 RepID=UPI0006C9D729|nr:serine proteinase stubble [Copidosoma floridanum]
MLCHTALASPVFVPQILSESTGRNIRHLMCVSRRTGETGICMFALTCAKANGTHLGTCIDSFYFGSCCKIDDVPDVSPQNNTIDIDGPPSPSKPQVITTTTTTTTTTHLVESNDIPGNVDNQKLSTTQSTSLGTPFVRTTEATTSTFRTEATKAKPSKAATKKPVVTEFTTESIKLSTFQSVQNSSHQRPLPASTATTASSVPTKKIQRPSSPDAKPATAGPKPAPTMLSISSSSSTGTLVTSPSTSTTASSTLALDKTSKKPPSMASPTERPGTAATPLSTGSTKPSSVETTLHRNTTNHAPTSSPPSSSTNKTPTTDVTKPSELFSSSSTRFPPRNATTEVPVSSVSIDSHQQGAVTTVAPTTTKKSSTTKKPSRVTTKKPIFLTISKKPTPTAAPPVIATTIAATVASAGITTASSAATTIKVPTTSKPAVSLVLHNVSTASTTTSSKRPVTVTSSKKPSTTPSTPTTTKKPSSATTTKATTVRRPTTQGVKKNATSSTSTPPKVTSSSKKPVPTAGPSSSSVTTGQPSSKTTTTPRTSPETTTTSTSSTVPPSTTVTRHKPLVDSSSDGTTPMVDHKNTTDPTPSVSTAEANATTPVPGIVTWTSVSDEVENSTKTSTNSTSETSETLETDWVPLTTPDGWIIIQSPTADKPDAESAAPPATQAPIVTNKPVAESTTPRASTTSTTTTTTTTTSQATTYLEQLSTVATVTASPDFADSTIAPINMSSFKDVCGRRLFPDARIVGGNGSTFGKWPWQISLRQWRTSTYLHKCGAALLNENWAITAAHCVQKVLPSDLLLRIGEYDLANEEEPYSFQERRVQIVASHPNFDPRTFEFDLALMRFYEPVLPFQPNVLPICVPDDDESYVGQTAYVTGWGRLYEDGPLPSVLQEVAVPVINNSLCEGMYRNAGYIEHIPHIFICAGWRNGGFDSCEGDSGGPLVIQRKRDKRWMLAGVISWGIGCAEPNQPGVYTRISEFREWINQILQF